MTNDNSKPTKKELISYLDDMIDTFAKLPPNAMTVAITHYDHYSLMLLLSAILHAED